MKKALFTLVVLVTASCATLNKEECQTSNWQDVGFKDGSQGESTTHFAKHAKACSEHGITPNRELYDTGYREGLRAFCTPDRAYELGRNAGYYGVTCPSDLTAAFNKAYSQGKDWRELSNQLRGLDQRVSSMEDLADREPDFEKRRSLRSEARALARDRDTARTKLLILESQNKRE